MRPTYMEYRHPHGCGGGRQGKYWVINHHGPWTVTQFGALGTAARTRYKKHGSPMRALMYREEKEREKERKGYKGEPLPMPYWMKNGYGWGFERLPPLDFKKAILKVQGVLENMPWWKETGLAVTAGQYSAAAFPVMLVHADEAVVSNPHCAIGGPYQQSRAAKMQNAAWAEGATEWNTIPGDGIGCGSWEGDEAWEGLPVHLLMIALAETRNVTIISQVWNGREGPLALAPSTECAWHLHRRELADVMRSQGWTGPAIPAGPPRTTRRWRVGGNAQFAW